MSSGLRRQVVNGSMLLAAVFFGMVLAGSLDLGPQLQAAPASTAAAPSASAGGPIGGSTASLPSFADLAEKVLPGVVSIDAQTIEKENPHRRRGQGTPFDLPFGQQRPEGDEPREFRSNSGGSGFVVSADGYVVTNNHVIEGATKIRVRLEDRYYDAELKGTDPATDLALLKIDAGRPVEYLPLGDSDVLRVGDYVMVIGNPLLLDHTVTVGVVSAKGRSIGLSRDTSFENFIQTDAAINRGNSGGPLISLRGEVVGIASAMNWGAENIGFAIPVNTLKSVLPQLRDTGKVSRGYLGINIQNLDWDRAQAFGLKEPSGALVTTVVAGSPADSAGVKHGDIVVTVDGRPIKETRDLIDYVSSLGPGKTVAIELLRDGARLKKDVKLAERTGPAEELPKGDDEKARGIDWLGLDYQDLTAPLRQNLGIPARAQGVVVRDIEASSPLVDEGVSPGDIVTEVNGRAVSTGEELEKEVAKAASGSYLRFYLRRFDPHRGGEDEEGVGFFAIVRVP